MTEHLLNDRLSPTSTDPNRTHEVAYDPDADDALTTTIVRGVAAVTGVDPARLTPPLYEVIDPQALEGLFADRHDGSGRVAGRVTFRYQHCTIVVDAKRSVVRIVEEQRQPVV